MRWDKREQNPNVGFWVSMFKTKTDVWKQANLKRLIGLGVPHHKETAYKIEALKQLLK